MPRVSIIIPVYNMEAFVAETIKSVLAQTYRDWEMIVVDDGSEDASAHIVARAAASDNRIRLLRNSSNRGLAASVNSGISVASGFYMARIDADDLVRPQWLRQRLDYLTANRSCVVASGSRYFINEDGSRIGRSFENRISSVLPWELIFGNPIPHPGSVCVMEAIRCIGGYDESLRTGQDWDLWVRLAERGVLAVLAPPMVDYRVNPRGISARWKNNRLGKMPLLCRVMPRMAAAATGLHLPENLLWLLYRNRPIQPDDAVNCQSAIDSIMDLYRAYKARNGRECDSPLLRGAVLDKVAHVSASAPWSALGRSRVLRNMLEGLGTRAFLVRGGGRSLVKLVAPLLCKHGRKSQL